MKNFSLKALGAFIFAAGLVVAGVASPALAAPIVAPSGALPTFTANTAAPAFAVTINANGEAVTSGFNITVIKTDNSQAWVPGTCSGTPTNLPACGVSITGSNLGTPTIYKSGNAYYVAGLGTATSITLSFDNTAWSNVRTAGNYDFKVQNQAPFPPTLGTTSLTVVGANNTVTFDANGGSGTLASQTAGSTTPLTSNNSNITRTNYTFNGWNTNANGSGTAYANGANYPFTSSQTLYAQWVSNSSGGGSGSSSSSSDSLANTGINSATGISLLAGGLSLALVGAEMFMIARRKRSN